MTDTSPATHPRLWPLYLGGALGPFGGAIINVILPELAEDLNASLVQVGFAVSAYLIPFSIMLLTSGTLGARWGLARTARIGFLTYTIGTLLCIFATTITPFLIGRAVQGIANAFTSPLLIAMILQHTTLGRQGRALGLYSAIQAAGYALAPLAGGMAVTIDFRIAFGASALFALVIALLVRANHERIIIDDLRPPTTFGSLVNGRLAIAALIALCLQFSASAVVVFTGLVAGDRFGFTSTERGLAVAGFGLAGLLVGQLVGMLMDRFGQRSLGPLLVALGAASAVAALLTPSAALMITAVWVGGIAAAGGRILFTTLALASTPQNPAGATSVAMATQFIGTAAVPLFIPLYTQSIDALAWLIAAVGLAGAIFAIIGTRTPVSRPQETVKELACPKSEQTLPLPSPSTSPTG